MSRNVRPGDLEVTGFALLFVGESLRKAVFGCCCPTCHWVEVSKGVQSVSHISGVQGKQASRVSRFPQRLQNSPDD